MTPSRRFIALAGLFALTLGPAAAQNTANDAAKDFPNRSIKIVVPFPAGGPTDVAARLAAQSLSSRLGQNVVIAFHTARWFRLFDNPVLERRLAGQLPIPAKRSDKALPVDLGG